MTWPRRSGAVRRVGATDASAEAWARCKRLADYNGRLGQGIVHTPEYVEHMRAEQAWYDSLTDDERDAAWSYR